MSRKLLLMFLSLFLVIVVGCGTEVAEPDINRIQATGSERDTYMSRAVWFPVTYVVNEKGEPTEEPDLEALFQKASDWVQENEQRISSMSMDIVNATMSWDSNAAGTQVIIPSGILITFTLKK